MPPEAQSAEAAEHPEVEAALPVPVLDAELRAELPTFEVFFKTFGFRRILGRVWGLLVLSDRPLSSKEIAVELAISQGATSTAVNELSEWGAITSAFDSTRHCHLHRAVGNTMSIVATVLRRREQVVFEQFKAGAERILSHVEKRHGKSDPRVLTLRSIISSCEIGEAMMQLILNAVGTALGDEASLLSKAVNRALRVGMSVPAKILSKKDTNPLEIEADEESTHG